MNLKLRWAVILIVIAWAVYSIYPLNQSIKLGLDLQGGMHVILGVETDKAVEAKIESLTGQVRKELSSADVEFEFVQKLDDGRIQVSVSEPSQVEAAKKVIEDNYPDLNNVTLTSSRTQLLYAMDGEAKERVKENAVAQSLEVVRNRVDEFGVSEPVIQRQGDEQVVVQLPGVTDPERAIKLIGKTAQLKFYIVDDKVSLEDVKSGNIPFGDIVLYQKITDKTTGKVLDRVPYVLERDAVLTGEYIVDANVNFSNTYNTPMVQFKLDAAGSKLFEEVTAANIGKRMAIVLDNNVYSAPTIQSRISGGSAVIEGIGSLEEAKDTAIVLRAGSLPAPVNIEENRTVGPSLGRDSISSGITAALIGVALIIVFMLIYYKLAGLLANIALLLNFLIILGVMSQFGATLTLPGIAGIILIIGMSVDANVLIFERVREELRQGRTPLNALEYGYEKAMVTIMDANITTIIAAVVLFQFGTGPIKGFVVTLSIGILASLFTAIFVTKTIFASILRKRDAKTLSI